MNVYKLDADANRYQNFVLPEKEGWDRFLYGQFDGRPMAAWWTPLEIALLHDENEDHRDRPRSDFPNLGGIVPVFSGRAADALSEVLLENGELLPLHCAECPADEQYFAYNPTRLVDALDESRSEVEHFKSSGRVMRIVRYEFNPDRLKGLTIFRLVQDRVRVYVTDAFVRRVRAANLAGFDFPLVWGLTPAEAITAA